MTTSSMDNPNGSFYKVASPLLSIENEEDPTFEVDAPLPGPLSHGKVFVQYRVAHMRLLAVFGEAAMAISPRLGHVHITIDDLPWHFIDASGETVVVVGLPPGNHALRLDLANPMHQVVVSKLVRFTIPG